MEMIEDFIIRQGFVLEGDDVEILKCLEEFKWYLKLKKVKKMDSLKAKFIVAIFFSKYATFVKKPPYWKLRLWAACGKFMGYRF